MIKSIFFLVLFSTFYSCNTEEQDATAGKNLEIEVIEVPETSMLDAARPDQDVREIFKVVQEMPKFGGCDTKECSNEALIAYIKDNIVYPESAKKEGIEGRALVQFVIEANGTVSSVNVVKTPDERLGLTAKNIVLSMNDLEEKWQPGKQRGKNVAVLMTLPFTFKI